MNHELETAIDKAGRDDVFRSAENLGWTRDSAPPEWVWWDIVRTVNENGPVPYQGSRETMSEALGLGRLF